MLKQLYFGIISIIDIILLLVFTSVFLLGSGLEDFILFFPILILLNCFSSISIKVFVNILKGKKYKYIRNSILMKISLFFTIISFSFLFYKDGVYAFVFFLIFGICFDIFSIFAIKYPSTLERMLERMFGGPNVDIYIPFEFQAKWVWEDAAHEYMLINHLDDYSQISDEESNEIYDYTVTPLSYLFYFLASKAFLSEDFFEDDIEIEKLIKDMLKRKTTPVEVLRCRDYYFSEFDMNEEILEFFYMYYLGVTYDSQEEIQEDYILPNDYMHDYMDYVDMNGRYFCVEFSWERLDGMMKIIRRRYKKYIEYKNKEIKE